MLRRLYDLGRAPGSWIEEGKVWTEGPRNDANGGNGTDAWKSSVYGLAGQEVLALVLSVFT